MKFNFYFRNKTKDLIHIKHEYKYGGNSFVVFINNRKSRLNDLPASLSLYSRDREWCINSERYRENNQPFYIFDSGKKIYNRRE